MTDAFLESEVKRLAENGQEDAAIKVSRLVREGLSINRMLVDACGFGRAALAEELLGRGADPLCFLDEDNPHMSGTACHKIFDSLNDKCAGLVISAPGTADKISPNLAMKYLMIFFDIAFPYLKDRKDIFWTDEALWSTALVYKEGREKGKLNKSRIYSQCLLAAGNDEDLAVDFSLFIAAVLLRDLEGLKRLFEKHTIIRFLPLYAPAVNIWRHINRYGSKTCEITKFLETEALRAAKEACHE